MSSVILTCNAGSNNTKLAAFDMATLEHKTHSTAYSAAQVDEWFGSIGSFGEVFAVAHRVVHGGQDFAKPARITSNVLGKLISYIPLAPLHQPAAIKLIEVAQKFYPQIPQIACFDTAFHHTTRDLYRRFALPQHLYDEGVMRYGFHGLSYQYIASAMPKALHDKRVIVAHLGGGASACAMHHRKSVGSTMGFSTLDGLMMGTRSGALDPGVLLYLLQEKQLSVSALSDLLYHESGLKGVSGISGDMQELLASDTPAAKLAVELFCATAAKEIAGLIPALGGVDALIFTGGIGEHAETVRNKIKGLLGWLGDLPVHVISTNEELVMAEASKNLVRS